MIATVRLAALLLWCLLLAPASRAEVPVPSLTAHVVDQTGTLTAQQQAALEQMLRDFEAQKGSQLAVLIVPSTQPESIEQYSIRVVDQWKLGRKKVDDGALLLVAKNDRTMRIEVGYGLEGVLPDAIAKRIISEVITPYFQRGDFYGGIQAGLQQMMRVIEGEPLPPPAAQPRERAPGFGQLLFFLFLFVLIGGGILQAVLGQFMGAAATGLVVAGLAWLLLNTVLFALLAGLGAFIFTLIGPIRGGMGGFRGMGGGWPGGGWSGGGGFGGGGWSGGGGGFGGGGASGRW
ncbi:YgcG family protein [Thermithiobacillus tepidarius DSM 3134]|uniref:TPM domain-containing protein n=1 Tax=Thermithiobacillus tepidarius TaxID=929 RepID=UPI000426ACFD|nr:YgcG family protein [Thermithiobacillus tepidarius]